MSLENPLKQKSLLPRLVLIFFLTLIVYLVFGDSFANREDDEMLIYAFGVYGYSLIVGVIFTFSKKEKEVTIRSEGFTDSPIWYILFLCPLVGACVYALTLIPVWRLVKIIFPLF